MNNKTFVFSVSPLSLNREKRMRELLRVTQENQEILKRITARRPEYNHKRWEKDWERNQDYMDAIASYPREWWKYQQQVWNCGTLSNYS